MALFAIGRANCGSHRRAARAAGAASQPSVTATEPLVACQSGTLTSEATILSIKPASSHGAEQPSAWPSAITSVAASSTTR
jgi:hypothetical protein